MRDICGSEAPDEEEELGTEFQPFSVANRPCLRQAICRVDWVWPGPGRFTYLGILTQNLTVPRMIIGWDSRNAC